MKAKWIIDYDFPVMVDGHWTGESGLGKAGDVTEHPDCWKLCVIRDHGPLSKSFGKVHAEPADDECRQRVEQFCKRQTGQAYAQWLTVDPLNGGDAETEFKKRFGLVDEEAEAKEAATAEFEARLMEGV